MARIRSPEMPGFIKPQLATLKANAPKGDQWLHEIKFDGYRVQVHLNKGKRKVYSRNGLDWTKRFSVIAGALDIPGQAIVDGEVVVIHDGRTNFSELQADLAAGKQDRLVYYARGHREVFGTPRLGVGGEGGRSFKVAQSATAARLRRRPFGDSTARSALAVLASGRVRAQQQRRPSGF
jgi:ATP dependent DNA ligase domain